MQESDPMKEIEARNKIRVLAREIGGKALQPGNEELLNKIVKLTSSIRAQYRGSSDFILLHDLSRGTIDPNMEASMPFDNKEGDIQKFLKELDQKA